MRRDGSILLGPGPDQGARLGRDERKKLQTKSLKTMQMQPKGKRGRKEKMGDKREAEFLDSEHDIVDLSPFT
jgi:hypothetical protein